MHKITGANTLFGGNLRNYIIIDNTDRDHCLNKTKKRNLNQTPKYYVFTVFYHDYSHHILQIMKLKTSNLSAIKKKVLRVG